MRKQLSALLGVFIIASVSAIDKQLISVGKTTTPPTLDGVLDDSCWKNCLPVTNFIHPGGNTPAEEQTRILFCRDNEYLYVAIHCDKSGMNTLTKASLVHDNKFIGRGESVELMFGPDPGQYYHFMINNLGAVYDAVVEEEKPDVSWNSGVKTAAGTGDDFWVVEMAIPLKNLSNGILTSDTWLLNTYRNSPMRQAYSSWMTLPKISWHVPNEFGKMSFVEDTPGLRFNSVPAGKDKSDLKLTFSGLPKKQSQWSIDLADATERRDSETILLPPGTSLSKSFTLDGHIIDSGILTLVVRDINAEPVAHYVYRSSPYFLEFRLASSRGLDGSTFTVCPEFPARRGLAMSHNFPGYEKRPGKVKLNHELIIELPRSCTVQPARQEKVLAIGKIERDGKELVQYSLKNPWMYNAKFWRSISLKTTMEPGEISAGYYYARWQGGQQSPRKMVIECIGIGQVTPPKRLVTSVYGQFLTPHWRQEEFDKYYNLGINTLRIRNANSSSGMLAIIDRAKKQGFYLLRDHFFPGGSIDDYGWGKWTAEDRDARALDINGYYVSGKKGYQLSPTYRGPVFEKYMKEEIEFTKKTGINWFSFDMEGRIMPNGDNADFHPRTLAAFKEYFAKNVDGISYVDPREFMKPPTGKYDVYRKHWIVFKCQMFADFFADMKKMLAPYVGQTSPWAGPVFSEWSMGQPWDEIHMDRSLRGPQFHQVFDFIEVDAYSGVERFVREQFLRETKLEEADINVKFIVTPSPRRITSLEGEGEKYYQPLTMEHGNELKYKIFESAAFGAKGIIPWHYPLFTITAWRDWVDGIRVVKKVEDIVLDGKRVMFHGSNTRIRAHGVKLDNRVVLVVSEYMTDTPMETELSHNTDQPCNVIDLETDQSIARIDGNKTTFSVALTKDIRARMLLIEPIKQ